jgi:hypothetical protein
MGGIRKRKSRQSGAARRHLFRLYESGGHFIWNSYARSYTSGSDVDYELRIKTLRDGASHEDFLSRRKETLRASRRVASWLS